MDLLNSEKISLQLPTFFFVAHPWSCGYVARACVVHSIMKMCRRQNVPWPICSLFIHRFVSCIQRHINNSIEYVKFMHFYISFLYIIFRLFIYSREHVKRLMENGLPRSGLIEIQPARGGQSLRSCRLDLQEQVLLIRNKPKKVVILEFLEKNS